MSFRDHVNNILKKSTADNGFGEKVKFFPGSGAGFFIPAVFDNKYEVMDLEGNSVVSDNIPNLGVNLNDFKFEIVPEECEVEVRGIRYIVIDKKEDGQGGAVLPLKRKRKDDVTPETRAD